MQIGLIIIAITVILIILIYNKLVNLKNNIKKSKSVIDVYLQQRFDLIPNLIEVTKEYMKYESSTLEKITNLRTVYNRNKDMDSIKQLNQEYNTIMADIENYPELRAGEQFLKLQKTLIKVEGQLQAARRIYNMDVTKYNIKISTFPNNIIAKLFNFKEEELFELGEDVEKINVEI